MSIVEETLRSLQAMELDRRRQRERDAIASGILGGAIATSNPYLQSGWANSYATYSSVTSSNASSNPNS